MIDRLNILIILMIVMVLFGCSSPAQNVTQSVNTPIEDPARTVESGLVGAPSPTEGNTGSIQPTLNQGEALVNPSETSESKSPTPTSTQGAGGDEPTMNDVILADVISVKVSGEEGAYRFSVGISSPDTGCDQYADWWEVISQEGELIYRRILLHSHVEEQPFVRSGGPVSIAADSVVFVRAHMNTGGYGGAAFQGSVQSGFSETDPDPDFAAELAEEPPLPEDCAF
jgi:hypothetical protein